MGEKGVVIFSSVWLVTPPLFKDDQSVSRKNQSSNSHEITSLTRERTEFNLQDPHSLTNVFVFFSLCHPGISIHQKYTKYCRLPWKLFSISYIHNSSHKPPCRENISRFHRTYCSWDTIKRQWRRSVNCTETGVSHRMSGALYALWNLPSLLWESNPVLLFIYCFSVCVQSQIIKCLLKLWILKPIHLFIYLFF